MREDALEIILALTRLLAAARQRLDIYQGDSGGNPDTLDDNIKRWRRNVSCLSSTRDLLENLVADL